MGKPEDIPQDAWDAAEEHRQLWARGPSTIKEAVSRAIMAARVEEREACAHRLEIIAATYLPGGPMDAKGGLLLGAAAIRKEV